jgi:hypothetical protein
MRRALIVLLGLVWTAPAHVTSMSSGDLTIDGSRAHYELRMPLYEVAHVARPDQVLLENVRFSGARMTAKECHADPAIDAYLCTADYTFAAPVEELEVECRLFAVTVPNHVHLLHVTLGSKREEAVFDAGLTRAKIRFRAANTGEVAVTESVAGFLRAVDGPVQLLFLLALALAARSRRELVLLAAMFVAGQCASLAIVPWTHWQPAPRFVEAATALTVAYLAVEILLLPAAGARWLVAAVLGLFHGLSFLVFVQSTGYHAALVLLGAALAEALGLALISYLLVRLIRIAKALRPVQSLAAALLVFGLGWFFLRLRG